VNVGVNGKVEYVPGGSEQVFMPFAQSVFGGAPDVDAATDAGADCDGATDAGADCDGATGVGGAGVGTKAEALGVVGAVGVPQPTKQAATITGTSGATRDISLPRIRILAVDLEPRSLAGP
jgi:hypothetical protein